MKGLSNHIPPKIPTQLLRWFCDPELIEDIEGDLTELYSVKCQENVRKAKLKFWLDVVLLFRPGIIKNFFGIKGQNSHTIMFKNYYKTSLRSLMKNPMSTLINLLGLSMAIGVCVLAYAFNAYTFKMDQFHEKKDQVYLVTFFADRDGKTQQNGKAPAPLGGMLKEDFAQIKEVCRIEDRRVVIKYDDNVFHEKVRYVDPEFLDMFTFPLKWGVQGSLNDVNSIILSENMSIKYFGDYNPVGEQVKLIFHENKSKVFEVAGVAMEFPGARSFAFDFLINFENLQVTDPDYKLTNWGEFINATFVEVANTEHISTIQAGMQKYASLQNDANSDWSIDSFGFEPLATLYRNSADIRGDISSDGFSVVYNSSISFVIIGLFVLALASSNYINIAIVSAARRLKEIGLRKVIGASRNMVIVQFLSENMLVMFIALIFGLLLGVSVFIPWLETNMRFDMDFTLYDGRLLIFLPAVLLITGIASGSYPALYISRFQASTIFRGSFKLGKKSLLTRAFLAFQLLLGCVLISIAVMFTQNNKYQEQRSWGYDQTDVLYVSIHELSAFEQFYNKLSQEADVISISGSTHHLGRSHGIVEMEMPDREYEVQEMAIDSAYFKTMGIELKEGRSLRGYNGYEERMVVVNQTLVDHLGLVEPVGQSFKMDEARYEIIGVVKDFHAYDFYNKVRPVLFRVARPQDYKYLSVQVRPGAQVEVAHKIEDQWAALFPEIPYAGGHQEDVWGGYNENMKDGSRFWNAMAVIVVVLAGLGLYGLVTLNVSGRVREFSIRKVLGAGLSNITSIIVRQYLLIFIMAILVGAPASYYLVQTIFDTFFIYHMPLNYSFIWTSGGILMVVVVGVVATQIFKVTNSNPVTGLKVE